jgi:hypothetical protein
MKSRFVEQFVLPNQSNSGGQPEEKCSQRF